MKVNKIKLVLLLLLSTFTATLGFSQVAAASSASANSIPVSVNTVLCIIALVLLFIIVILAMTVGTAIEFFRQKKETDNNASVVKNVSIFLGLILLSQIAFSQTAFSPDPAVTAAEAAKAAASTAVWEGKIYFYGFIAVIVAEIAIILFFIKTLSFLTGIDKFRKTQVKKENNLWQTINQFKPLEDEDNMDTGHNYDGIRELDNITPPWFTIAFAATILFAIVYLYRYEVAHTAPSEIEEYETEMREAKVIQDSLLKLEGNNIDENTVAMLDAAGIASGQKIYTANCSACHGDKGQGGVGPNLTDEYWIHSGSIKDVFKSIKYGWVEKGMKSWKEDFSPTQIAQLSSFIKSLKGSNPPGAKEKQGELYVETATPGTGADSTKTK